MLTRNEEKNKGIKLFVDYERDLTPIKGALLDSWYIKSDFTAGGKIFAFTWHQGIIAFGLKKTSSLECVFMNVTDDKYVHLNSIKPVSKTSGVDKDSLYVFSEVGYLKGDHNKMVLEINDGAYKVNIELKRKQNILYNGATGLIDFGALKSYEFAYPDMEIHGTFTFDGFTYKIEKGNAWFDRQWGKLSIFGDKSDVFMAGKSKWLWMGLVLDDKDHTVLSLWDIYTDLSRRSFVTSTGESDYQLNANANIVYQNVWISTKTGFTYPDTVAITVSAIDLELVLTSCTKNRGVEFVQDNKGLSGCQCLYKAKGKYKDYIVDTYANLEMIGNLCG
jgi:predicted secreted hydrolase